MKQLSATYGLVLVLATGHLGGHPADSNKDFRIDQTELTLYGQAYKNEAVWPEGPSPIEQAHYERAVFIWQAGERYRAVEGVAAPNGWVPDPLEGSPYVALSTGSVEPFDLVTVHGINGERPLEARFRLDNLPGYFEILLDDSEEDLVISMPLNPLDPTGEGTLSIELVDTESGDVWRCPPLRLQPLPESAGAGIQLVSSIGSTLEQSSLQAGYELEFFLGLDMEFVPYEIRPLVYMKSILDHPDNPDSFEKVVGEQMSGTDLALWDSIVAKLDLANRIASPVGGEVFSSAVSSFSLQAGTRNFCEGNFIRPISNALTLSQLMTAQNKAETENADKRSARDIADVLLSMKGNFDFGKQVGEALQNIKPNSPVPGVLDAVSQTLLFAKFFDHYDAGTLPSEFVSLELQVDGPARGYFVEDDQEGMCGEATLTASATVQSAGYDHEKMLADVVPGSPVPGVPGPDTLYKWVNENYPDIDILDTEPVLWCGIVGLANDLYANVTGDDFLKVTGYNNEKVGMDFEPLKAGPGLLTVEIISGKFGGASITETKDYETRPIKVEILSPQLEVLGNEESVIYLAHLSDAAQTGPTDLDWTVTAGQILNQTPLGNGRYQLEWKPTDNESDYPVTITAKSTTEVCLRGKEGAEPRMASIMVDLQGWEIFPVVSCLEIGAQEIFIIDDGTDNPPEVTWEVVSGPGIIEADTGLFTAGPGFGDVVIRATRNNSTETREQTFRVGCSLFGAITFDPADAPSSPATVKSLTASLTVGFEGLVSGDVFLTYESFEPPAEGEQYGHVSGTYQGAGRYYPNNFAELSALTDATNAIRSYPNGEGETYDVVASYFYEEISDNEGNVLLPDGPDGDLMEIRLDAVGYSRAGFVRGLSNEIVSYFWTFSDGTSDVGSSVTKTFSRTRRDLVIELEVFDKLGNWARIKEKILIVQINGTYRFAYDPSHTETACIYWTWPGDPPDDLVDPNVNLVTTRDPDACGSTVILTGGRSATISAESTQVGIDPDDPDQLFTFSLLNF
ncbi:MAG: hypothetical protein AB3N64_12330 [Puniceicoccaceae bacterium]